eukprot:GFUD01041347.1.p1 GENE.GFUD01041347.1~~GFUD01041347.1.p1  ORF type:complete len:632 (-),score=146.28 GFUD01041347.1:108-2003(-)
MTSVTSDLVSLLTQYRVLAYHNLETDRDEGLVFVKLGEEDSTGQLVRFTGENDDPGLDSLPHVSGVSTAPLVTTSPPTLVSSPWSSTDHDLATPSQECTEEFQPIIQIPHCQEEVTEPRVPSPIKKTLSNYSKLSRKNVPKADKNKSSNLMPKNLTNSNPIAASPHVGASDSQSVNNNPDPDDHRMSNSKVVKDPVSPRTVQFRIKLVKDSKVVHSSMEKFKQSAEAGWVREVVKGDKKCSEPGKDKVRVAYLPPLSMRHIKTRLYNRPQLQAFFSTNCPETEFVPENFSFSGHVLGLGMPWEVVRPAHLSLDCVLGSAGHPTVPAHRRSKSVPLRLPSLPVSIPSLPVSIPSPASCLHCGLQLPQPGPMADQHVRQCLHSKNARLRTLLGCEDYSPAQYAMPVKCRQSMPEKTVTQSGRQRMPEKTVTQSGRQSMQEKTVSQLGRESMLDKTVSQLCRVSVPEKTVSRWGRLSMPELTISQSGTQSMQEKIVSQSGRQSMLEKMVPPSGRQSMPKKTDFQPGRQNMQEKTDSKLGRQSMPEKAASQSGRLRMPEKTVSRLGRESMPEKTISQSDRQCMPEKTVTKPYWESVSKMTVTQPGKHDLPERIRLDTSLSLGSLPDCISVSKIRR